MNKLWELRSYGKDEFDHEESRYGHRYGRKKSEEEEAYECGFEDGYEKAIKEMNYGERRGRGRGM